MGRPPGFRFHEQDMLDVTALRGLLTPDTVIVHLAAKAGVRPSLADPVGYARANVTGTAAVLEAARRAGVSRIVFGSSSSVYGDSTPVPFREDAVAVEPVSPYAATKRAAELLLRVGRADLRLPAAPSLRFFTVYGPRQRPDLAIHAFTRQMVDGRDHHPVRRRHPGARLHLLRRHRRRRARRHRLDRDGADGRGDVQPRRQPLGAHRARWWPRSRGRSASSPGSSGPRCSRATSSGRPPTSPSRGAVLGYAPRTPFPEGIRRFVAWFREAYGRSD